jgi:glycosyltransferase 2 family protein
VTAAPLPRRSLWKSRGFQLALGATVSLVCLWWSARELISDPQARREFLNAFRDADYLYLPVLLVMLVAFYALKAYRWKLLLTPLGNFNTWTDCFGPMLSGFAVNNVLPARAGEFVRVIVFARRTKQSVASVFVTVALERIFDMLSILVYLSLGLFSLPDMPNWMRRSAMVIGAIAATGVVGAVVFLIWTAVCVRWIHWGLAVVRVPETWREKIDRLLETAAAGLASLKSPMTLLLIVVVSLLQWALNGAMMYLALRSFGVDVPISAAMVLLGVVALGVAVPASPGFFGVIQVCFTDTLQIFPVNRAAVLAASIYYHILQYIPVTLLGLLWLNRSGFQMREVTAESSLPEPLPPTPAN